MRDTIIGGWTWRADTLAAGGRVGMLRIAIQLHEIRGEDEAVMRLLRELQDVVSEGRA